MRYNQAPTPRIRWLCAAVIMVLAGGCATIPYLHLSQIDRKHYFELLAVSTRQDAERYAALPDFEARAEFWRMFWKEKDPTPTTELNERYEEHLARVAFADENFPSTNFCWDDRGKIYIKYGDPDDREWNPMGSAPSDYMPSSDPTSDTTSYAMVSPSRGWERWVYSRLGHEFIFVQHVTGYRLSKSLYSAQTFNSSITTAKVFLLNEVDRGKLAQLPSDSYHHDYGQPLDFPFGLSRFGDSLGAETWVYYSVPLAELAYDSSGRARLSRSIVIFDREMREAARDDRILSPPDAGRMIADAQAIDVCRFRLATGDYTVAISLEDTRANKTGIYEYKFPVIDYLKGAKEASDLLLAREIVRDTAGTKFRKGEYRIVPQPSHTFKTGADLFLYYEVYNLKPDSAGQYRTEVRHYIISQKEKTARGTAPEILTTARPRLERAAALSLKDLPEGEYHVLVTARDLAIGKERSMSSAFKIVK